jgi:hypothetical protein
MNQPAPRGRAIPARRRPLAVLEALAERLAAAGDFEALDRLAEAFDRFDDQGNAATWPMGWVDTVSVTLAEAR